MRTITLSVIALAVGVAWLLPHDSGTAEQRLREIEPGKPIELEHAASRKVAGCVYIRPLNSLPRRACIIRQVFREDPRKAVNVAWCESRLDPNARNGQYRGVFQMGSSERARFGHGRTVLAQALAAHRYFVLSGWRPWECA